MKETSMMDNLNRKTQSHARVCKEINIQEARKIKTAVKYDVKNWAYISLR